MILLKFFIYDINNKKYLSYSDEFSSELPKDAQPFSAKEEAKVKLNSLGLTDASYRIYELPWRSSDL